MSLGNFAYISKGCHFTVKCCQILKFFEIEDLMNLQICLEKSSIFMKVLAKLILMSKKGSTKNEKWLISVTSLCSCLVAISVDSIKYKNEIYHIS